MFNSSKVPKGFGRIGNTESALFMEKYEEINERHLKISDINKNIILNSSKVPMINNIEAENKKQGACCYNYSFTYNNYPDDYFISVIPLLKDTFKWFVVQQEIGEAGETPHLQGCGSLFTKKRFTQLKALNEHFNKFHWEPTNNKDAAIAYCQKAETRKPGTDPILHGRVPAIKDKNLKIQNNNKEKLILLTDRFPLKNWQNEIINLIKSEPQYRTIHWFYEPVGQVGKSAMCKLLCAEYKSIILNGGKRNDMINHVFNYFENDLLNSNTPIIVDIPRAQKNIISYTLLEEISNGLIVNCKYETGQALFNAGHIIVFSNDPPMCHTLSHDRLKIYEIDNDNDKLLNVSLYDNIMNVYDISENRLKHYLSHKKYTMRMNAYLDKRVKKFDAESDSYESDEEIIVKNTHPKHKCHLELLKRKSNIDSDDNENLFTSLNSFI